MRASAIRAAIASTIEAIVLPTAENPSGPRGKFRAIKDGRKDLRGAQDRRISVRLASPPVPSREQFPTDSFKATWEIYIFYADTPSVDDKMANDSERIGVALEVLPGAYEDIHKVSPITSSIVDGDGLTINVLTIETRYRIDPSLIP